MKILLHTIWEILDLVTTLGYAGKKLVIITNFFANKNFKIKKKKIEDSKRHLSFLAAKLIFLTEFFFRLSNIKSV